MIDVNLIMYNVEYLRKKLRYKKEYYHLLHIALYLESFKEYRDIHGKYISTRIKNMFFKKFGEEMKEECI